MKVFAFLAFWIMVCSCTKDSMEYANWFNNKEGLAWAIYEDDSFKINIQFRTSAYQALIKNSKDPIDSGFYIYMQVFPKYESFEFPNQGSELRKYLASQFVSEFVKVEIDKEILPANNWFYEPSYGVRPFEAFLIYYEKTLPNKGILSIKLRGPYTLQLKELSFSEKLFTNIPKLRK